MKAKRKYSKREKREKAEMSERKPERPNWMPYTKSEGIFNPNLLNPNLDDDVCERAKLLREITQIDQVVFGVCHLKWPNCYTES